MGKLLSNPRLPVLSDLSKRRQESVKKIPNRADIGRYLLSFEVDILGKGKTRYHWMICSVDNPDQLLSWGYAPTHELAATDAKTEMNSLSSGLSQGGQVKRMVIPFIRRRAY